MITTEGLKEIYNSFLGNESFHPALMGKIELALEEAYIQGRVERRERMLPNNPREKVRWVNLFMNPQDGKIFCQSEIFETRLKAIQTKSENEDFVYVTTVMIKWEEI